MKYSAAALASLVAGASAQKCSPFHLIYARATTEPPTGVDNATPEQWEVAAAKTWSKGYGAAGASLANNLTGLFTEATTYPVHYPASMGNSAPKGVTDLLDHIGKQAKACPDQKFALGGHSQGGMVTVSAIPKIPKDILSRVVAVTMFGSPGCPAQVRDRCHSYCLTGDFVCDAAGGKGGKGGKGGIPKGPGAGAKGPGGGKGGFTPKGGKGGLPKGPPKGGEEAAPPAEPAAPAGDAPAERRSLLSDTMDMLERRQAKALADCAKYAPGPEITVTGRKSAAPGNAHLAYNADGYHVYAATCFLLDQYKKSKGS